MELQHVNVKVYVDGELAVEPTRFIDVFHRWIREGTLDEMLVDVADYRHVPAGPGVLLVGFEGDYSMDHANHRWGLRYNRKAVLAGTDEDRLRQAFRAALHACRLLEDEFASLQFSRQEFELFVNDRALAPNTPETYEAYRERFASFFADLFSHDEFTLHHHDDDPRERFGVTVQLAKPMDPAKLLARLAAKP